MRRSDRDPRSRGRASNAQLSGGHAARGRARCGPGEPGAREPRSRRLAAAMKMVCTSLRARGPASSLFHHHRRGSPPPGRSFTQRVGPTPMGLGGEARPWRRGNPGEPRHPSAWTGPTGVGLRRRQTVVPGGAGRATAVHGWQAPFWHLLEQHWSPKKHGFPTGRQPQVLPLHLPPQHSEPNRHPCPSALQSPQTPLLHCCEQHS